MAGNVPDELRIQHRGLLVEVLTGLIQQAHGERARLELSEAQAGAATDAILTALAGRHLMIVHDDEVDWALSPRFWWVLAGVVVLPWTALKGTVGWLHMAIRGRSCPGCGVRPGRWHEQGCELAWDGLPWA